jgi:hypothetical protein
MPTQHPHPLVRPHSIGAYRVVPEGPLPDGRDVGGPDNAPGWRQDWFLEAEIRDPETGRWTVFSASLVFALNEGTFSAPWEKKIPASTLEKLERLADRLAAADLF